MAKLNVEELLALLSRQELLRIAREGRELGLLRPTYPLSHYDAQSLRRLLRRYADALAHLPSVQAYLHQYSRRSAQQRSASMPSEALPALPALMERLFPGVHGMEAEKEALIEWIYLPLAAPQQARRYGLSLSPTLLVEGPPGTGKSFLLRQFAQGSRFPYKIIHTPALANQWYGVTERRLRHIIHFALQKAPVLLIFEELESLFPDREQNLPWLTGPVQQFLLLLDEIKSKAGIAVIGITNHAQRIDKALLRPGRFDHKLYVPPPDFTERLLFLSRQAQNLPFAPGIDWTYWAEATSGYTRADLAHLLQEAGRRAFLRHWREGAPQLITEEDLRLAFKSE